MLSSMEAAEKQLQTLVEVKDELYAQDIDQANTVCTELHRRCLNLIDYRHVPILYQEQASNVLNELLGAQVELSRLKAMACGEEHTPAKEVVSGGESAEVASSVETPRKPSAAAGSLFLPELWVCEECNYQGDPNDWSTKVTHLATRDMPEEKHIVCPDCGVYDEHREADVEWLKEILAGNDAAITLVETLNNE